MSARKELGKIEKITLGGGGYQDAMFGVSVALSFGGSGVGDFRGNWSKYPGERAQYTEAEWEAEHAKTYAWLRDLMRSAKVDDFTKLRGIPVEVEFEGNTLKSWRVLSEVL